MKKKTLTLLLLASLLSTSAQAFYMAWARINDFTNVYEYPEAVMDIAHDSERIYVAALGGLMIIDKATGEKTYYSNSDASLDYTPTALAVHDGKVFVGTRENKMLILKGESLSESTYDFTHDRTQYISNIVFDRDSNMYVSNGSGTTFRIGTDGSNELLTAYPWGRDGWTAYLATTSGGTLWIANFGWNMNAYGLAEYTHGKGTKYLFMENAELPIYKVTALAVDNEDGVWYASSSTAFSKDGKKLLTRLKDGQVAASYDRASRYVDMQFDGRQRLWLAGDYGPLEMMKDGEFTSYPYAPDGERWFCLDVDGDDIYIGTEKSLLLFRDGEYQQIDLGPLVQQAPTSIFSVTLDVHAPLYDLQGRRLSQKPERGVYIRDGRKVVIK